MSDSTVEEVIVVGIERVESNKPTFDAATVWVWIPVEVTNDPKEPTLHVDSEWARTYHPGAPRLVIDAWHMVEDAADGR